MFITCFEKLTPWGFLGSVIGKNLTLWSKIRLRPELGPKLEAGLRLAFRFVWYVFWNDFISGLEFLYRSVNGWELKVSQTPWLVSVGSNKVHHSW